MSERVFHGSLNCAMIRSIATMPGFQMWVLVKGLGPKNRFPCSLPVRVRPFSVLKSVWEALPSSPYQHSYTTVSSALKKSFVLNLNVAYIYFAEQSIMNELTLWKLLLEVLAFSAPLSLSPFHAGLRVPV